MRLETEPHKEEHSLQLDLDRDEMEAAEKMVP